jgi:outer membrane receptor protein involved in Fe transport
MNAQTNEPLLGAQVTVEGTVLRATTGPNGQYVIDNVPAGTYAVRVTLIGYGMQRRENVRVTAGATTTLAFPLRVEALALDEIIATGQAVTTARREIGTSIGTINAEALMETAPVGSVSQLLQSRVAGVTVMPSGGNAGQGSRIVLRGVSSLSQNVEPLIYIDGVRMDNSKIGGIGTNATWTSLDDINPEDIERVEIVKGAAAATLYGTEASAGVIQIFTKRGKGGPQRWEFKSEYGLSQTPREWWDVSIYSDWFYDTFVRTGRQHMQRIGVSGSLEGFSYNLSGTVRGNEGIVPNSSDNTGSFRANMSFTPAERFSLAINTGYTRRNMQLPQEGNNTAALVGNALRGGERGIGRPPAHVLQSELGLSSSRFITGVTASYTPLHDFVHRLTVGADILNADNVAYYPFGGELSAFGSINNYRREARTYTLDYAGSYKRDLTSDLRSSTSFGFQGSENAHLRSRAQGSQFAAPGLRTVNAAANTSGWEDREWQKTGGFFVEQQIGVRDRLFVTGGARWDGHSAFGAEAGYAFYPKIDASYVVSEHGFWPKQVGTLRLRSAYGTAGKQPSAFASEMTWDAIRALEGVPAVTTGNLGNPELTAEVSHEFETGFDAGLLRDRVAIEYTHYRQRTKDALYGVRSPPSQGFINVQLANVGELRNLGHELMLRATPVDLPSFRWTARTTMSTNQNTVVSLGGEAPISAGNWSQQIRAGYPVGAMFEDRFIMVDGKPVLASEHFALRDPNGNKILDPFGNPIREEGWDYIGPAFPTRTLALGSEFTFARYVTLNVLADHKGGHFVSSSTSRWLNYAGAKVVAGEPLYDPNDPRTERFKPGSPIGNQCINPTDPIWVASCSTHWADNRGNHIHPADSWRLREVSLAYRLPKGLAEQFRASNATLSLAGRNLWRSQKYIGLEAEANYDTFSRLGSQTYFDTPIPRQLVASVSVNF